MTAADRPSADRPGSGPRSPARRLLTAAQRGLWAAEQMDRSVNDEAVFTASGAAGSAAFHINASLRLRGPLDSTALHTALNGLLERHPILRARVLDDGELRLEDRGPTTLALPLIDFSASPGTAEQAALARVNQEVRRPFVITQGPMLRSVLLRLAADDHVLCLVVHHLVADGLALATVYRDLGALYRHHARGEATALPEPVSWFDLGQSAPAGATQLERLAGPLREAPVSTELPFDRAYTDRPSTAGAALQLAVPDELWQALLSACARLRVSPYMILLATYAALLSRVTGSRDLVIGTPSAGRTTARERDVVGMFVTTWPLHVRIDGDPLVSELLSQVRDTGLGAMAATGLSFEDVIDHLRLPRTLGSTPLVQAVCSFEQLDNEPPAFGELTAERVSLPCTASKFELSLGVQASADGVLTDWEYRTDLFDEATVVAMAEAYLAGLRGVVAEQDRRLSQVEFAAAPSVLEGRRTAADGPVPAGTPVSQRIAAQAARTPDAVALISAERTMTYRELDQAARAMAARWLSAGARPEEPVVVAVSRGVHWAVAVLGAWYAGTAIVPVDTTLPRRRVRAMLDQLDVRRGVADTLAGGAELTELWGIDLAWITADGAADGGEDGRVTDRATVPGSLAYIMFTSGSTGTPKPVAVGHDALAHHAGLFAAGVDLTASDVSLQFAALSFDVAFEEVVPLWCVGGAVVLIGNNAVTPADLETVVAEHGVTLLNLPSSYWAEWVRDLRRTPRQLPASLRTVVIGSEAGYRADLDAWLRLTGVEVLNAYGQTETTITSMTWSSRAVSGKDAGGEVLPIGAPMLDTRLYVLDAESKPVEAGLVGELYLAGPSVSRGYHNRPRETADRFLPDPFSPVPGQRMYRTGDRGRIGPDGQLRFLGRVDDVVKVRGQRVGLREVEALIRSHPGVADTVARANRTAGSTEIVAYIEPAAGPRALTSAEVRAHLVELVPGYMVPAHLVIVPKLPRTPGGKLDPSGLPPLTRAATDRDRTPAPVAAPGTGGDLQQVWAEVLGVPDVAPDDNFFALGGDSILAIRVVSAARELGLDIAVVDLFRHQTLAALVEHTTPAERARGNRATTVTRSSPEMLVSALDLSEAEAVRLLARFVDAEEVQPAGPLQEWGLDRLRAAPRPGLFRVHEAFDLTGTDADADALVLAWQAVAEHHPALRTSLHRDGDTALQVVHRNVRVPVERHDLRELDTTAVQARLGELLTRIKREPVAPEDPCQVRLHVLDLGPGSACLLWTFSYLVVDGWSFPHILADLFTVHDAIREGRPWQLPARPAAGATDRAFRTSEAQAEAFWKSRARVESRGLAALASAAPEPDGYAHQRVWLGLDETTALVEAGRRDGLTLHTLVLGAYALSLGRMLESDCVVFGTVLSGRSDPALDDVVGSLGSRLPVWADIPDDMSCLDWLRQLQSEHAEVSAHGHVSLIDLHRWVGTAPGSLYDTEVIVQNFPFGEGLQGRLAGWNPMSNGSRGDSAVRLTVWPDPSMLLKLSHDTAAVSDRRALALLECMRTVLERMSSDLTLPLGDYSTGIPTMPMTKEG
ncbi:non-ribosomal peptide synthetase [Kitasatospora purpeofusca]|uniref:non-ribosomal peptide synthetase n=1 Tax=Kitasatospora purpeofusca TaxID=67352 RepID=UPI0004BEF717|nr:non-ribosomal peptide synthetase [Kitasatospora purpeofusca]